MPKLALQADVWYNEATQLLTAAMLITSDGLRRILIGDASMDTLPPHAQDGNPHEKARKQAYYHENHERLLAQKKAYYQANREKILAEKKAYQSQPEVNERRRAYNKAYHGNAENKSRIQAQQKARYDLPEAQEQRRAYHQLPRVKAIYKAHSHNRRALEKNVPGTHTPKQIEEQYQRQKGKCYYCHKKVEWSKHHVDHVIPLTRGGSNDIGNLVIACQHCNQRKHRKLPSEWPQGGRLL